jgi:hypothetical protein
MSGGYANIFDTSAMLLVQIAAAAVDVSTVKSGAEVDRRTYSDSDLLQHLAVVATVDVTIATPNAADNVDITLEWEDSATAGSGYADFKSVTTNIATAGNSSLKAAVVLPVKLLKAERYGIGKCLVAMGSGSVGTLSAAEADIVYHIFPLNGQPVTGYDTTNGASTNIQAA